MKIRYLLIGVAVLFVAGMWLFDEGNGDTAKGSSGNKIY